MKTLQLNLSRQWSERPTKILALLLGLVLLAFAVVYARDRYFQPNQAYIDRELQRYEEMVRQDPGEVRTRLAVANAYLSKGMYDRSISQFQEALKLSENNLDALVGLGAAYAKNKQDDKALEALQKVVDIAGGAKYASSDRRLNGVYYEMGTLYINRKQYDEAIDSFKNALTVDRSDSDAYYMIGLALLAKNEPQEAVAAFTYATAFVPNFVDAYRGMQSAYERTGEKDKVAYAKGMITLISGRYDDAIKQLEAVVKALPDFVDGWFGLGMAYEVAEQKGKAIVAYEQTLALQPQHKVAQDRLRALGK